MGDAQDWGLFYIPATDGNVLSQTDGGRAQARRQGTEVWIYSSRAKEQTVIGALRVLTFVHVNGL